MMNPGSAPSPHSPLSSFMQSNSSSAQFGLGRTGSGSYPLAHPTSHGHANGNGAGTGHSPERSPASASASASADRGSDYGSGSGGFGSASSSGSYDMAGGAPNSNSNSTAGPPPLPNPNLNPRAGEKRLSSELSNMDVQSMIDSLRSQQVYDYLRVCTNPDLRKFLDSASKKGQRGVGLESVQFSDIVVKINRKQKRQERALVITDKAIYNFAPKSYNKCKRRITLDALRAVILSLSSQEIVFQVDNSYDYRFDIARRSDVLEMISKSYEKQNGKPLTVHMSAERELKNFCRTKSGTQPQVPIPIPNSSPQSSSSPSSSPPTHHTTVQAKRSSLEKNAITTSGSNNNLSSANTAAPPAANASTAQGFRESRLEGWLTKKKGKSDKWDRKYFILSDSKLQYYSPRIKGNMQIAGKVTVERVIEDVKKQTIDIFNIAHASIRPGRTADGHTASFRVNNQFLNYRIKVVSENRRQPLHIAAESESEMLRWMQAFSGVTSSRENKEVHLEGWLMKKDPTSKNWRRRYFVLIKDRCWYFEMGLKGTIDMTSGVSAHAANVLPTEDPARKNFAYETASSRYAYRWNVSDSARIFYLAADTFEQMQTWIVAIEKASRRHFPLLQFEEQKTLPDDFVEAIEQEAPDKLVTFVFTDVQNSTNLWEAVPDAMDLSLEQHDRILRELLKKYRGYEVKTEGDAFMVTFFSPIDAVCWCLEVQQRLLEAEWSDEFLTMPSAKKEYKPDPITGESVMVFNGIRIRMGIHCGEPNCRRNPVTGRMDYFGPVVNRSARVSDVAHGGQVVGTQELVDFLEREKDKHPAIQGSSYPIVTDLGAHNLKGILEPVRIFQLMPQSLSLRTLPPIRTVNNEEKEKQQQQEQQQQTSPTTSSLGNGGGPLSARTPPNNGLAPPNPSSPYRASVSYSGSSPPPPPPPGVSGYHAAPQSYSTIYPQSSPQLSYPYNNVRPNPNEQANHDDEQSSSYNLANNTSTSTSSTNHPRKQPPPPGTAGMGWALPGLMPNAQSSQPPPPPRTT